MIFSNKNPLLLYIPKIVELNQDLINNINDNLVS